MSIVEAGRGAPCQAAEQEAPLPPDKDVAASGHALLVHALPGRRCECGSSSSSSSITAESHAHHDLPSGASPNSSSSQPAMVRHQSFQGALASPGGLDNAENVEGPESEKADPALDQHMTSKGASCRSNSSPTFRTPQKQTAASMLGEELQEHTKHASNGADAAAAAADQAADAQREPDLELRAAGIAPVSIDTSSQLVDAHLPQRQSSLQPLESASAASVPLLSNEAQRSEDAPEGCIAIGMQAREKFDELTASVAPAVAAAQRTFDDFRDKTTPGFTAANGFAEEFRKFKNEMESEDENSTKEWVGIGCFILGLIVTVVIVVNLTPGGADIGFVHFGNPATPPPPAPPGLPPPPFPSTPPSPSPFNPPPPPLPPPPPPPPPLPPWPPRPALFGRRLPAWPPVPYPVMRTSTMAR